MPSAATGETLAERAQRILGLDIDMWLSTELSKDTYWTNKLAPASRVNSLSAMQNLILNLHGELEVNR